MSAVLERRNQQVYDALRIPVTGHKQALQLIQRRIKKGEKNSSITALRAYVLTRFSPVITNNGVSSYDEALALCLSLTAQDPPPHDTETLGVLEKTLLLLHKREEMGKLHEKIYKSLVNTPGRTTNSDKRAAEEWFGACVRVGDYGGMQKAAMYLQKQFPHKREYYFWAIAACILLTETADVMPQQKTLFEMLAYRMITKAASDVPEDESEPPSKAIKSSQELQLLYYVLSKLNKEDESIKWLKSNSIGLSSPIAEGDEWLYLRKLLEILERQGSSGELWQVSAQALLGSVNNDNVSATTAAGSDEASGSWDGCQTKVWQDDWKIWQSLITAATMNISSDAASLGILAKTQDVINEHCLVKLPSRNALLASVLFGLKTHSLAQKQPEQFVSHLQASMKYFDKMGSKSCCYDDLSSFVSDFTPAEAADFMAYMKSKVEELQSQLDERNRKQQIALLTTKTNWLKFRYIQEIDQSTEKSVALLNTFLGECFDVYRISLDLNSDLLVTDNHYGDDVLLLTVQAILAYLHHMNEVNYKISPEIPIIILNTILEKSPHNFKALLLLTKLYHVSGAFTLASATYQRLSIKQIQNDTISHHVLCRLSLAMPFISSSVTIIHASSDNPDIGVHNPTNSSDALEMLRLGTRVYGLSEKQSPDMINLAFEKGSYGQLADFVAFRRQVETSICKQMWEIEKRRIQRLRNTFEPLTCGWDQGLKMNLSDNRDWNILGNGNWLATCELQKIPKIRWTQAHLCADGILLQLTQSGIAAENDTKVEKSTVQATDYTEPKDTLAKVLAQGTLEDEFYKEEITSLKLLQKMGEVEWETRHANSSAKVKTILNEITEELQSYLTVVKESNSISLSVAASALLLKHNDKNIQISGTRERIHSAFLYLESCRHVSYLHDFLTTSTQAKAMKPPLSKTLLTNMKQAALKIVNEIQAQAKHEAKQARMVTENDIDASLGMAMEHSPKLKAFLKEDVGRDKVERMLDTLAISRSEAWLGVCKAKFV